MAWAGGIVAATSWLLLLGDFWLEFWSPWSHGSPSPRLVTVWGAALLPIAAGVGLAGVVGLLALRSWRFSLRTALIWTTVAGLLLGATVGLVKAGATDHSRITIGINNGRLTLNVETFGEVSRSRSGRSYSIAYWLIAMGIALVALPLAVYLPVPRGRAATAESVENVVP